MLKKTIIITAGGIGKRMGANIPKQFLLIDGKPILMQTIAKFYTFDQTIQVVLVLPSNQISFWQSLCKSHDFKINHEIVEGGLERFDSVKNGLSKAKGDVIGVHDAVRPLVANDVIENCFKMAELHGAAIPIIAINESVRKIDGANSIAENRYLFRLVQTPQCFKADIIFKAYQVNFNPLFTDDASVIEANGGHISLVHGNRENIKITTPFDLKIAEMLMRNE